MMMRKRTNRCRNTVWDISVISRNKNGETLCGDQCALEWDDNDATVILSDGLGSGVKANILSTLTTTMLTTMLKGNVPIDECVTTVAETLPMCKERKLAYATFTILQTAGTRARLIQYDNPNAVFVHNGAIGKYNYSVNFIQEKELHESYLHFDVGDMLVLFSDGVSEAGRGVTTDAGWARQDIEDFILRNYSPTVSSQRMAASILSTVKTLDMDAMHDDTTVVVARLRERCPVNVMIGPPESKDDDLSTMRLFFGKDGKHVVCGGTTANAVASYLGVKVHTLPGSGTEDKVADERDPRCGSGGRGRRYDQCDDETHQGLPRGWHVHARARPHEGRRVQARARTARGGDRGQCPLRQREQPRPAGYGVQL